MSYAFGVSFVYEKEAVEDISTNWPQFRSRFLQDFKTVGIFGGQPSKKHKNVYKTSDETVFIHWHWENTKLVQMVSRHKASLGYALSCSDLKTTNLHEGHRKREIVVT